MDLSISGMWDAGPIDWVARFPFSLLAWANGLLFILGICFALLTFVRRRKHSPSTKRHVIPTLYFVQLLCLFLTSAVYVLGIRTYFHHYDWYSKAVGLSDYLLALFATILVVPIVGAFLWAYIWHTRRN